VEACGVLPSRRPWGVHSAVQQPHPQLQQSCTEADLSLPMPRRAAVVLVPVVIIRARSGLGWLHAPQFNAPLLAACVIAPARASSQLLAGGGEDTRTAPKEEAEETTKEDAEGEQEAPFTCVAKGGGAAGGVGVWNFILASGFGQTSTPPFISCRGVHVGGVGVP
jgi:hypothetical protein